MTDAPDATSSPSPQAPAAAEPAPRPTASLPEGRTGASDAAGAAVGCDHAPERPDAAPA